MSRLARVAALAVVLLLVFVSACGGDDDNDDASKSATTSTTATATETLHVLVTNDDGFAAPGLDAVVEALRKEKAVEVTVVAPATNQSGTGDDTTPGELAVTDVRTKSGYAAKAVAGHPADAVNVALDRLGLKPDLVVSGTNAGQNIGPLTEVSGTVGAAKTAARRGIPALAASTGLSDAPDYATSARRVVEWVDDHRKDLLAGDAPSSVESLNTPTCPSGDRGVADVALAADVQGRNINAVNCASKKPASQLTDDVDAFLNGFTSETKVPLS